MPQILCTRPNASDEISGVKFTKHESGMVSEEISDEAAAAFLDIPGYELVGQQPAKQRPAKQPIIDEAAAAAAQAQADADAAAAELEEKELAELVAKAKGLGIEVKTTWKAQRLTAEIKRAEETAAAAQAQAEKGAAAGAAAKTE